MKMTDVYVFLVNRLAVLGVTDQFVHFKTPRDKYMEDVMALQSHVSRHNHRYVVGLQNCKMPHDGYMVSVMTLHAVTCVET